MNKTATLVVAIVFSVLAIVLLLDRGQMREQMEAVYKQMKANEKAFEKLEKAQRESAQQQSAQSNEALLKTLEEALAKLGDKSALSTSPTAAQSQYAQTNDGLPALETNFLLPAPSGEVEASKRGGTLSQFQFTPKGMNPIIENSATTNTLHGSYINDSLAERSAISPEKWHARLAESIIPLNDWKTYEITLRKGVKWQVPTVAEKEGFEWLQKEVELTSKDFAFFFDVVNHADTEAPHLKAYFEPVERIEIIDDYRFRVHWKEKLYTSLASTFGLSPLPKHVYGANEKGDLYNNEELGAAFSRHWFDEERQAIGVGPYRLMNFEMDKEVVLQRNPGYWNELPYADTMRFDLSVKQPDPRLVAFKNGQVHVSSLAASQYKAEILDGKEKRFAAVNSANPKAGREGELGWEKIKTLAYTYIGWNMRRPLFADKKVRQALTHCFPKQRIIDDVYFGLGQAQTANVHPDSVYALKDIEDYAFDPNKAIQLLNEAGWSDTNGDGILDKEINGERVSFSFTITYYQNSPEWDKTLAIYRDELRNVGIEMKLKALEWKFLLKVYEDRDFDAVSGGWRMSFEVDFEQLWHSKFADEPSSSNHCGFKNAEADKLAEELRRTFDIKDRVRIAQEFQRIIFEEQPYTFFRSSEGIFTWQNSGENKLYGVTEVLDENHPFYNRDPHKWRLAE